MTFANYTDTILSALIFNPKQDEVISRKNEILQGVYRVENLEPSSVLFVGFNPAILACQAKNIAVTEISETAIEFLKSKKIKFTTIDEQAIAEHKKQYQCVVAMDEYFTFADSDAHQQSKIKNICSLATDFVISTLRDYKNQDYKDREFSQPIMIRNGQTTKIFLESHDWDLKDNRIKWNSMVYEIDNPENRLTCHGIYNRRTMFFKQLAKFSIDEGALNFLVHKNLMYKSPIKKNYEHVVSIQFN